MSHTYSSREWHFALYELTHFHAILPLIHARNGSVQINFGPIGPRCIPLALIPQADSQCVITSRQHAQGVWKLVRLRRCVAIFHAKRPS